MGALLTTGDLARVAGLPPKSIDDWVRKGLIVLEGGGNGTGDFRRFSLMTSVGVAVAVAIRRSDRGCVLPYAGRVVRAFSAMSEEELVAQFEEGETHFVLEHMGRPILRGEQHDWVDVRACYVAVKTTAAQIEEEGRERGGRRTGLADVKL